MIAVATIEGKEYNIPMSYKDVSLGKFKAVQDFLYSEQYKDITEQIINKDIKDEESTLNFMLDYINYVTGIPLKQLKKVRRFSKDDETGVEDLFYAMSFLFTIPVIDLPEPAERLGEYYFVDKIDLTQAILEDLQFIEYTEANNVIRSMNGLKDGKYERLNLLLAILYRPKEKKGWFGKEVIQEYDSDLVQERAKEFDSLDMDTVWNCLFFFMQLKVKSLKSISKSLQEELGVEAED